MIASWFGCTAQKRYVVLSFFFDGVPDPSKPAPGSRGTIGANGQVVLASHVHKPYADGNCQACHTGGTDSVFRASSGLSIESDVCLKCHQKVLTQYPVMHGPVTSVECLRCHTPHESNSAHLLSSASPRVCVQCHTPELLSTKPPEHMVKTADCLSCHSGHGGLKHKLLLDRATTRPATQPAPSSKIAMANPQREKP